MKRFKHIFLLAFVTLSVSMSSWGQCVMCKALGEQSANQGMMGTGLNQGIIFIMIMTILITRRKYLPVLPARKRPHAAGADSWSRLATEGHSWIVMVDYHGGRDDDDDDDDDDDYEGVIALSGSPTHLLLEVSWGTLRYDT